MLRSVLLVPLALIAVPAAAVAQQDNEPAQAAIGQPPQRIRNVQLTGTETCPTAQGNEVVVCNRINPDEQYRIPKNLRKDVEIAPQNQSWVNRTAVADDVSRRAAGIPDTCSPVGSGGQTGCALAYGRAWAAEKRAAKKAAAEVPGGEN